MFENRTSGLANRTDLCPDFECPDFERLKTILYLRISDNVNCPNVWNPDNIVQLSDVEPVPNVWNPDVYVRILNIQTFGTGSNRPNWPKPVRNRFWSIWSIGTGHSKSGRCKVNEPDVRNPDVWEPDKFRKRQNPDVRISDVYCIFIKS